MRYFSREETTFTRKSTNLDNPESIFMKNPDRNFTIALIVFDQTRNSYKVHTNLSKDFKEWIVDWDLDLGWLSLSEVYDIMEQAQDEDEEGSINWWAWACVKKENGWELSYPDES